MDESQTQNRSFLAGKLVSELQAIAEQVGVKDPKKRKKAELIDAILGIAPQPSSSPAASEGSAAAPSLGREYEAPSPEAAQPNGDARAATATPTATTGGSAEGSTDTSTAASPEASTQASPQSPPETRPEYRREGEGG